MENHVVFLFLVCHNGIVDEKPEQSMLKEFKPQHSLRPIIPYHKKETSFELTWKARIGTQCQSPAKRGFKLLSLVGKFQCAAGLSTAH